MRKASIRRAVEFDLLVLVKIAKQYYDEAVRWYGLSFDAGYAVMRAALALEDADQAIFVVEYAGEIVGMAWLSCSPALWSFDKVVCGNVIYVLPEARSFQTARGLMKKIEEWAGEKGAKIVFLGDNSGVNSDRAGLLFKYLGYSPGGENFYKEV